MKRYHVFVGCHDRGEQPAEPLADFYGRKLVYYSGHKTGHKKGNKFLFL